MKRLTTLFALVAVISAPIALAAELAGFAVPALFTATNIFSGFIFAVLLLTAFGDYAGRHPTLARLPANARLSAATPKSAHPLAA